MATTNQRSNPHRKTMTPIDSPARLSDWHKAARRLGQQINAAFERLERLPRRVETLDGRASILHDLTSTSSTHIALERHVFSIDPSDNPLTLTEVRQLVDRMKAGLAGINASIDRLGHPDDEAIDD